MDMEDMSGAVKDLAALSTRLLLRLGGNKTNLAFSPLSFHSVLVLLAAGATGETLDQIQSFLGPSGGMAHASLASYVASTILALDADGGAEPDVRCAVGVWVDSSLRLRPAFADKVASQYKAAARAMPFQEKAEEARVDINRWFEDKTGGLIRELMPVGHLNSDTVLVFGNALYLRATWFDPFDPDETVDGDFFLADESSVRVPFMKSRNSQRISCHPGFKVLQLPFEGGGGSGRHSFSMHIYLPDERDGLQALVCELSSDKAGFLDRCVPAQAVEVGDLRIPKFKVSRKIDASLLLQDMGLKRPFWPSHDFAEMVDYSGSLR
uniref:Serpin domain-containing protein n=1 Tax=Hordeum vulgare subsp. vulgare TaxID=112509 RepID=A0A8I6YIB3_HORVV